MPENDKVSRIIFNFNEQCNLDCDFCYVPFDNKVSGLTLWEKIIDRCIEWDPKLLTFGGGDPFLYPDFRKLLTHRYQEKGIYIHVDTNGLGLKLSDIGIIKNCVNRIGLPLDGMEKFHTLMRKNTKHFYIVTKWLEKLLHENIRIKINTVISKKNLYAIDDLAQYLNNFPIDQWSIYQFWPLSRGWENREEYLITVEDFQSVTQPIKNHYNFTNIDVSSISDRVSSHFFVTHTGIVYTEKPDNPVTYNYLGSIFDENIISKWHMHSNVALVDSRTKLRINAN